MVRRLVNGVGLLFGLFAIAFVSPFTPSAWGLQSNSYSFEESTIGAGGMLQASSANFQARSANGAIAVGDAASTNYNVSAGPITTNEPTLSVAMSGTAANFGSFSASTAATATSSFSVINYTSYGYVVQIEGDTLKNGSHEIPALASNTASSPGNEQFGMNLVANTSPSSIGSNPNNGQFGFGFAATNYDTPNSYRYVSGEMIAYAPKSSGQTTYTISYLANVKSLTPGGQYRSAQTIVVVGTY